MKFLIDTHVFLWWDLTPQKLSTHALEILEDKNTNVYLSHISIWEMQIKSQLGKLNLRSSLNELIQEQQTQNGIVLQPLYEAHIYGLAELANHHRDPFDRLLISQAVIENFVLITDDALIKQYDVNTLW